MDAVIDGALFDRIAPALRDGGKLVDLRARNGELGRGIEIVHSNVRTRVTDQSAIRRLREQVEFGELWASVAQTYPASAATEAHRRLDEGGLRGRIVLLFNEYDKEFPDPLRKVDRQTGHVTPSDVFDPLPRFIEKLRPLVSAKSS